MKLLAVLIVVAAADVRIEVRAPRGGPLEVTAGPLDAGALAAVAEATRDPSRWPRLFPVRAVPRGAGDAAALPTLLGSYRVEGDTVRFRSRFPVEPGTTYEARLDLSTLPGRAGAVPVVASATSPAEAPPSGPATEVVRVSPSGDTLPENLLRFYLEFSAPMSRGEAYDHLKLLDGSGRPIDLPFLELGEELWDPSGTRFTLLFDPGRIKTGLRPREEAGPVLEAGKSYTLVIDAAWPDASGRPLKQPFRKKFRAGPADVTPPDPANWRLEPPRAGTRAPLAVRFPEPLDRAMLRRVLAVRGPDGKPVAGRFEVGEGETSVTFTPEAAWAAGRHELAVDRSLEDRVGNTIGRTFEVDVFQKVDRSVTAETVTVPFDVRPDGPALGGR